MQILVTRELGDEYIWLKALSKSLKKEDAIRLTEEAGKELEELKSKQGGLQFCRGYVTRISITATQQPAWPDLYLTEERMLSVENIPLEPFGTVTS